MSKNRKLPKTHWLQMLNPTRSWEPNLDFDTKVKIYTNGRVALTPEKNTFRLLAGYHTKPVGPIQLIVNPKYANNKEYHLGIISLMTLILPVAVLSEVLNISLYNASVFKGENRSFLDDAKKNVKKLKDKDADDPKHAWLRLLFTGLLGLYQIIRIPLLISAVIAALAIWLPQMILSFIMSTLVFSTRPIWQPIANFAHKKNNAEDENLSKSEEDDSENDTEAAELSRRDEVSNFFGGLIYAFSKIFQRRESGSFVPFTPINTSDLDDDYNSSPSSSSNK